MDYEASEPAKQGMTQRGDGTFWKGLSLHSDFTSVKKTLHNTAELKVMGFVFFKMLVINVCVFFLEYQFTGSREASDLFPYLYILIN